MANIALFSGFRPKIQPENLSSDKTRTARAGRWTNLVSLYQQIMLYFETHLAKPTVDFCVPDLNAIAQKDTDAATMQALIYMNALVLRVYTHSTEGLMQFRKLSEAEESILEQDIISVGANAPVSVKKNYYTE